MNAEIHEIYNGQVLLRFEPDRHIYKIRITTPDCKVDLNDGTKISFEENRKRWTQIESVTQITKKCVDKPLLINWAVDQTIQYMMEVINPGREYSPEELKVIFNEAKTARWKKLNKAGNVGTEAHKAVEAYIKEYIENDSHPEDFEYNFQYNQANAAFTAFLDWIDNHEVHFLASEYLVYSASLDYCGTLDSLAIVDGKLSLVDVKTGKGIYPETILQMYGYGNAFKEMQFEDSVNLNIDQGIILHLDKENAEFTPHYFDINDDVCMTAFYGAICINQVIGMWS